MQGIEELAHAKVNLFLRVLRRREDGFHEIETFMAPITLCDSLELELCECSSNFTVMSLALPAMTIWSFAPPACFFPRQTARRRFDLRFAKKFRTALGLGGGSSDAAAALRGLNRFFDARLSSEKLITLAAQLGSDVPFFVNETAATCSGRGEIVTPAALPVPLSLLLLKPEFGVPSPWAYSRWQATREVAGAIYQPQKIGDIHFVNDLERPVFEKFVFLAQLKSWLLQQPEVGAALMSGSGSTIFAVLRPNADGDSIAKRAKSELDPELWTCVCQTF